MTSTERAAHFQNKISLYTRGKVTINDVRFLLLSLANTYSYNSLESGVFSGLDSLLEELEISQSRLDKEPQEVHNVTA